MREEKWVLSGELLADLPPAVLAFRLLYESEWDTFEDDLTDNDALKFFNTEQQEFSSEPTWSSLCASQGIEPYHDDWAIPQTLPEDVQELCREIRLQARMFESEFTGGCKAFRDPKDPEYEKQGYPFISNRCVLVVGHDGGGLKPFFNAMADCRIPYQEMRWVLEARGFSYEHINQAETAVLRKL